MLSEIKTFLKKITVVESTALSLLVLLSNLLLIFWFIFWFKQASHLGLLIGFILIPGFTVLPFVQWVIVEEISLLYLLVWLGALMCCIPVMNLKVFESND